MITGDQTRMVALMITALATVVVAVTGVFGYFLLEHELKALQTQNLQMEKALLQTYRPLGTLRWESGEPGQMSCNASLGDTKDKLDISYNLKLHNSGAGVLIDIGSLRHYSQEAVDFRSDFLRGSIDSVILDGRYKYSRMDALLTGEENVVPLLFENLPFRDIYYFYSLHLYLDQDGNLYDTQHLDVWRFDVPTPSDSSSVPTISERGSTNNDVFHKYTPVERSQLLERLRSLESTMVPYLE